MSSDNIKLKVKANNYPSWQLSNKQICDLELILNGGFDPLNGFLSKHDYDSVLKDMRLKNGILWPLPITLDVDDDFLDQNSNESKITLRDKEGFALAILTISDIWKPDLKYEAKSIFGTLDTKHPGVNHLLNIGNKNYIGGAVEMISLPHHHDYNDFRHSPDDLKNDFKSKGWDKIVAFQTMSFTVRKLGGNGWRQLC